MNHSTKIIRRVSGSSRSHLLFSRRKGRRKSSRQINDASDSYERLKEKLRESNFILIGMSLCAVLLIYATVLDYYQSSKTDSFYWLLTAVVVLFVAPLLCGITWEERRIIKEKLAHCVSKGESQ